MADEVVHHPVDKSAESTETTDRGLFDFLGAKKKDGDKPGAADYQHKEELLTEFEEKVHVSKPEPKYDESKVEEEKEKKPSLLDKLHRSGSSSCSSSSDEEEVEEGGEKKKKKKKSLKEKIHKEEDTSVPVEKYEETVVEQEEKKGFLDKIKDKLPGGDHKKAEEEVPPLPAAVESCATVEGEPAKEKKGILEKIKEKIPGYHPKSSDEDKKEEKEKV